MKIMSFNDFVHRYNLKKKATSNTKHCQVFSYLTLKDVGTYLKDGPFSGDIRVVNLHPSKGTHWVCYINENFFDSYGCAPPQKLTNFFIERSGHCFYSEYEVKGLKSERDSYCATYCLYILYFTKVLGIDFKSAVLKLFILTWIFQILQPSIYKMI